MLKHKKQNIDEYISKDRSYKTYFINQGLFKPKQCNSVQIFQVESTIISLGIYRAQK